MSVLAPQIVRAHGAVTYLSSLSPTSTGSPSIGSDSWLAAGFYTGTNASGYMLNSIQLGMTDASGNPSGFAAMLYGQGDEVGAGLPGSSLGALDSSLNPVTGDIFTYTPTSNITLSPTTHYFVILTSGTPLADGVYNWSESIYPPSSSGAWSADNAVLHSGNGTSGWSPTPYLGIAQFAINAIPIPEPSVLGLLGLGGWCFLWHRRKRVRL